VKSVFRSLNVSAEDIANVIGLMLTFSVIIAFIQFALVGRVDILSLVLGLFTSLLITLYLLKTRKRCSKHKKHNLRTYHAVIFVYAFFILSLFCIFPIFPIDHSVDFLVYIERSLEFAYGVASLRSLLTYHPATYLLLASILSLNVACPLIISRMFMLIMILFGIPLLYVVSRRLFSVRVGVMVILLSIFVNVFWYYTVFSGGLYANFLGILSTLYLFLLVVKFQRKNSLTYMVLIPIVSLISILLHETSLIFLSALFLSGVYDVIIRGKWKLLFISIIALCPMLVLFILFPPGLRLALNFIYNILTGKKLTTSLVVIKPLDSVYKFLSPISPILADIYVFIGWSGLVLTILAVVMGMWSLLKRVEGLKVIPFFWLMLLYVISYFTNETVRLGLITMVPVVILCGVLGSIVLRVTDRLRYTLTSSILLQKIFKYELLIVISLLLLINSKVCSTITSYYLDADRHLRLQYGIVEAMEWITKNVPSDAYVVSVYCWQFRYMKYVTGRDISFDAPFHPRELLEFMRGGELKLHNASDLYVVVRNDIHSDSIYLVNSYGEIGIFEKVWENNVVTVFKTNISCIVRCDSTHSNLGFYP